MLLFNATYFFIQTKLNRLSIAFNKHIWTRPQNMSSIIKNRCNFIRKCNSILKPYTVSIPDGFFLPMVLAGLNSGDFRDKSIPVTGDHSSQWNLRQLRPSVYLPPTNMYSYSDAIKESFMIEKPFSMFMDFLATQGVNLPQEIKVAQN